MDEIEPNQFSSVFAVPSTERRTVSLEGLRVGYLFAGPDETDCPPVVLLHGGGFDRAALSWKHAIPALADGRRVYALDWPGYGASDPPDVPDERVTTEYYVGVLDRFLDALGIERAAIGGISMGGAIALGFALANPTRVYRLALVDSYGLGGEIPGGRLGALFVRLPYVSEVTVALVGTSRRLTALVLRGVVAPGTLTEALVDEVHATARRPGTTDAWRAFQQNEVGPRGLRTNYLDRLPDLDVPVLVVHGERDPLVPPEWAVRVGTLASNAEVRILPDCGHWAPRERPERVNRLLGAFLE